MLEGAEESSPTLPQGPGESHTANVTSDMSLKQEQIFSRWGRERRAFSANSMCKGSAAEQSSSRERTVTRDKAKDWLYRALNKMLIILEFLL